jgi:hypothetical protein
MPDASPDLDSLTAAAAPKAPAAPGDIASLLKQSQAFGQQEQGEEKKIDAETDKAMARDRAAMDKASKSEEDIMRDVQPWQQQRPEPDPLTAFGSLGSVFGILASTLTHQPFVNSLNAAASAINASRANDLAGYQDAYTTWKENTTLALKRQEMEHQEYKDAQDAMKEDFAEGQSKLRTAIAKWGSPFDQAKFQANEIDQIFDRNYKATDLALKIKDLMPELEAKGALNHAQIVLKNAQKTNDPAIIADATKKYNEALDAYSQFQSAMTGIKPGSISEPVQVQVKNPDGTTGTMQAVFDKNRMMFVTADGKAMPIPNVVTATKMSTTGSSAQPYTDEQLDSYGAQRAAGMPINQVVSGYGKAAGDKRDSVNQKAIDLIKSQHPEWPKEQASQLAGLELANRTIEYQAGKTSVSQLTTMRGATKQAVDQLDFNIGKVKEEMKKLGSSNLSPVINAIARGEEKWTGDPAYSGLYFYMNAVATESARILSGGQASRAQLHAGAMEEAQKWANINMTPASFDEVADAMHQEGQARMTTYDDAIKYQSLQGGGRPSSSQPNAPSSPASSGPQEGMTSTSKSGKPIIFKNGQWEYQ